MEKAWHGKSYFNYCHYWAIAQDFFMNKYSQLFLTVIISCVFSILSYCFSPPAWALVQIPLLDVDYKSCPAEMTGGDDLRGDLQKMNCFLVFGKANNTTNKTIYDADVFGHIYDADYNDVMENRSRLGLIEEIPPGLTDFEIRVSVPATMPEPLHLEQFKAAGFKGRVRR